MSDLSSRIRSMNDMIRKGLPHMVSPHKVVMSCGIVEQMAPQDIAYVMKKIKDYDKFDVDNGPYEEHDFGSVYWNDEKIFWKFDYYDEAFESWKEDGIRVLTIMFADEY